ncbi:MULTISPECIES: hypothetical protein [Burkholderia]|uniref:MarR family transcriptional regulator n=1 Tax=Burkholderia sola TaxID=2843302 RepID=A0ABV2C1K9_9BURK|nr:hypothetical protein [Burkholderia sp. CpTa8-5]MBP0605083.1 hypothetical protein [Burkholderia sp. CpTa8-5]
MHRAVCVFTFVIRNAIMLSSFARTSDFPIITPSIDGTPNLPSAEPDWHRPPDTDGECLLSPHEIAILMVLASEPRRQQGDPADLHCLVDRGLVRLDAVPLAEARVRLSDRGRQMVSRLEARNRARCRFHDGGADLGRGASLIRVRHPAMLPDARLSPWDTDRPVTMKNGAD